MKLRGEARSMDVHILMCEHRRMMAKIETVASWISAIMDHFDVVPSTGQPTRLLGSTVPKVSYGDARASLKEQDACDPADYLVNSQVCNATLKWIPTCRVYFL